MTTIRAGIWSKIFDFSSTLMSNSENMDNLTVLYAICFTLGTNLMHVTTHAYGVLVFFPAFFYKFMLFEFWVKDNMGTVGQVQIAQASLDLVEK